MQSGTSHQQETTQQNTYLLCLLQAAYISVSDKEKKIDTQIHDPSTPPPTNRPAGFPHLQQQQPEGTYCTLLQLIRDRGAVVPDTSGLEGQRGTLYCWAVLYESTKLKVLTEQLPDQQQSW